MYVLLMAIEVLEDRDAVHSAEDWPQLQTGEEQGSSVKDIKAAGCPEPRINVVGSQDQRNLYREIAAMLTLGLGKNNFEPASILQELSSFDI